MRFVLMLTALLFVAGSASAKDIALPLNEREQAVLRNLLDIAVKTGGLDAAPAALHFVNKMQALQQEQPPVVETPKPKE